MTGKDRVILEKMAKWARKAEIDYQAVRSEYEPGPFTNSVILTAFSLAQIGELSGPPWSATCLFSGLKSKRF